MTTSVLFWCTGRVSFPTEASARAGLRPTAEAYRCGICGTWHVRTKPPIDAQLEAG